MKRASLKAVATKMKNLDFCIMVTQDGRGVYHSRPMSNNGKVEYDGTSWFFSYVNSKKVKQLKANPKVNLVYQRDNMLFVSCSGKASIIKEKKLMEEKWVDGLERWFPKGIETAGICLIKVTATKVQFWDKKEEGEYHPKA